MDLSDMACLSPSGTLRRHGFRLPKQTIELTLSFPLQLVRNVRVACAGVQIPKTCSNHAITRIKVARK
jgi:hypothetical protein